MTGSAGPARHAQMEIRRLQRRLARRERTLRDLQDLQRANSKLLARLLEELAAEKSRSEALLRNILPEDVIARLERSDTGLIADAIDSASVVFADFIGFTPRAARMSAPDLVTTLNALYSAFDDAAERAGVEKIKTIGDAYLAASGLHGAADDHADAAVDFALALGDIARSSEIAGGRWPVRVGVHSGPLTAGVIGKRKFAFDIWGDTVNVASRVQSASGENEVLVSDATAERLSSRFALGPAREIELKGRGVRRVYSVRVGAPG